MGIIYLLSFLFIAFLAVRMRFFRPALKPYMTKRVLVLYGLMAVLPIINTIVTVVTIVQSTAKYSEYKAKGEEWMEAQTIENLKKTDEAILRLIKAFRDDN